MPAYSTQQWVQKTAGATERPYHTKPIQNKETWQQECLKKSKPFNQLLGSCGHSWLSWIISE